MTTDKLNKALAAFFMCFGADLPPELKQRIRERTYLLAAKIEHDGDTTVAKLARGFADALATPHSEKPSH